MNFDEARCLNLSGKIIKGIQGCGENHGWLW